MAQRRDSVEALNSDPTMDRPEEPVKDRSRLIFVMFYALGTLTFVPQNFYITANDYWMYKFRDPNNETSSSDANNKTELQTNFTAYYSIVSNVSMVTFLVLTFLSAKRISLQQRIIGSQSVMLVLFIITLIFIWADTDTWQHGFFGISLLIGALLNGAGACFMISIFQLSSKFPPVYLGAQLSGQAVCGVLAALVQILTLALGTSSKINAFIYFAVGAGFILGVQATYVAVLIKVEYFQNILNTEPPTTSNAPINRGRIITVAKKLASTLTTMVLTAGSTVMIHPAVTSLVESVGTGRWSEIFFVPVCTFLSYNLLDFLGRECSLRWKLVVNMYIILAAAILRLSFIPLLMLCNIQPRNHLPVVFNEDYSYIVFVIVFSFTNGYLVNLCIVQIPGLCKPEDRKIAVFLIVLTMVVSLATCSFFGSVLIKAI